MLSPELIKHAPEMLQYLRSGQFERTSTGIYFPRAKVSIGGVMTWGVNDEPEESGANLIVDEGLIYLLTIAANEGPPTIITPWYMALFNGAAAVASTWTAANFTSTAQEIISGTEGYTEAARVQWVPDATDIPGTFVENTTSPAAFTFATASQVAVSGAALLSASAKGSTAGVLLSAKRFPVDRLLNDTDTFNLKYKLDFTSTP